MTTLHTYALTTLAMARTYLKVPTALVDAELDDLIKFYVNAGTDYLERECDRQLKKRTNIVEVQHGRKQNILLLREWPVTAISEVRVDGEGLFTAADTLMDAADYKIGDDGNSLIFLDQVLPSGYNNVQVKYDAGYDPVPTDLEHACLWLVFWYSKMRDAQDIGRPRRSKGDESFEISQSAPKEVVDCIMSYKRTEMAAINALIWNG